LINKVLSDKFYVLLIGINLFGELAFNVSLKTYNVKLKK